MEADATRARRQLHPSSDIIVADSGVIIVALQLFPKLSDDGIYIIEDLQWQSPAYEDKDVVLPKTAHFLIEFFVRGHYIENPILSFETMKSISKRVRAHAWFPSFDGASNVPKLFVFRT